ncbi:MAG: S-adenosyl-l-methionine hydroxide adenosyltransferase family protein [Anaerolineaceae bacterium]|nr:S-adenosyl-l-methionine hydroxide adenosyltransferase family protein [Anaerolineaceae bacterium]
MKPILVFQTDFTYKEGAVCAMYGVVKSVDRKLEIIDGTHEIPKFDVWSASYRLYQSMRFWPEGTIFVSVVDPGVGTSRRACAAKTADGYYVVSPDNGSLTHLKHFIGITEVREIDQTINRLKRKGTEGVAVFHGRDLFSYCAARLASGIITYEQVGPDYPVKEIVTLPILKPKLEQDKVSGIFEINDPNFGNLWTNIPLSLFNKFGFAYGDRIKLTVRKKGKIIFSEKLPFCQTFGCVEKGEAVIYNNELMLVALAVNQGSFCERFKMGYGPDWQIEFSK